MVPCGLSEHAPARCIEALRAGQAWLGLGDVAAMDIEGTLRPATALPIGLPLWENS
jgi:hypothetical protein